MSRTWRNAASAISYAPRSRGRHLRRLQLIQVEDVLQPIGGEFQLTLVLGEASGRAQQGLMRREGGPYLLCGTTRRVSDGGFRWQIQHVSHQSVTDPGAATI